MPIIAVNITTEQEAQLKGERRRSGAPVSLQVRRALDLAEEKRARYRKSETSEQPIFQPEEKAAE
jgi:hypothetical protein